MRALLIIDLGEQVIQAALPLEHPRAFFFSGFCFSQGFGFRVFGLGFRFRVKVLECRL